MFTFVPSTRWYPNHVCVPSVCQAMWPRKIFTRRVLIWKIIVELSAASTLISILCVGYQSDPTASDNNIHYAHKSQINVFSEQGLKPLPPLCLMLFIPIWSVFPHQLRIKRPTTQVGVQTVYLQCHLCHTFDSAYHKQPKFLRCSWHLSVRVIPLL